MGKPPQLLPVAAAPNSRPPSLVHTVCLLLLALAGGVFVFTDGFLARFAPGRSLAVATKTAVPAPEDWCPLPAVVSARDDGLLPSDHLMRQAQRVVQVDRLAAAVRVPTQSFDDNGDVDTDPRWAPFDDFHRLLEDLFPRVHARFVREKVNRYGLLYTLSGAVPTRKPIVFMAHQDVVPADPADWTFPPFAGHYDGSFLWGRGAADCKNVLIGLLSTMENLLEQGFSPNRTIILSFGFDEETGGDRGATTLAAALERVYGPNSVAFILDEGGMGVQGASGPLVADASEGADVIFAYPGVGEKGYLDLELRLAVSGGHSSRPPPHTGIGIMADVVHALEYGQPGHEDQPPFSPRLDLNHPFRRVLECRARHAPAAAPAWLSKALLRDAPDAVAVRLIESGVVAPDDVWLLQTSQAVDVLEGGRKVNALPEHVRLAVNYRIALHEHPVTVVQRMLDLLVPVVRRHGLHLLVDSSVGSRDSRDSRDSPDCPDSPDSADSADSSLIADFPAGTLILGSTQLLPVAPLSPTSNAVWHRFAGTLRSVFESTNAGRGRTVVPVGSVMTGNTDTTHYWALTRNIYRFTPSREGTRLGAHAIDERMELTAHLEGMRVYYDLVRNFDSWDYEELDCLL